MLLIKSSVPSSSSLDCPKLHYNIDWVREDGTTLEPSVYFGEVEPWQGTHALSEDNTDCINSQRQVSTFPVETTVHKRNLASIWDWNPRGRSYQIGAATKYDWFFQMLKRNDSGRRKRKMASQWAACSRQDPPHPPGGEGQGRIKLSV